MEINDIDFENIEFDTNFSINAEQTRRIIIEKNNTVIKCFFAYEKDDVRECGYDSSKFRQKIINGDDRKKSLLLEIHNDAQKTVIYPFFTWIGEPDFLLFKYGNIKEIEFDGFIAKVVNGEGNFYVLEGLPKIFIKTLTQGLGFKKEYRFIIDVIQNKLPNCEKIIISKNKKTQLLRKAIIISEGDLDLLRRGCDRIINKSRQMAIEDRLDFVYNELFHKNFSNKFPENKRPIKKDVIYRTIKNYDFYNAKLSNNDKDSLLDIKDNVDISYFSSLTAEFKELINKNATELSFQEFFNKNPLLLTTISGAPYICIKDQAYVGGKSFNNQNGEYVDFLLKHQATNNSFIIEIKRPSTKLLEEKVYRSGVYPPTKEITGAITQIITQKYNLETKIANLIHEAEDKNVEAYNVQGLIIAGKLSSIDNIEGAKYKKRSFELFRSSQKNIKIITYDECLHMLEFLIHFLTENVEKTKIVNDDNEDI